MDIFQVLGSLMHNRKKIPFVDETFVLFLVNKWVTMYDPKLAVIINDTTNKHWVTFPQAQDQYEYLYAVLWRMPFKRTAYIKKTKKKAQTAKEKDADEELKVVANNLCLSVRELKEYKELLDLTNQSTS